MMTTTIEQGMVETDRAPEGAGREWIVDACGCSRERLRSLESVRAVCERAIRELELQVVGQPLWRQFPGAGGVTGLYLLSESHLACHTWPESGLATFNLFSCRHRGDWPWADRLCEMLGAESVSVRIAERGVTVATGGSPAVQSEGATA
ncbi:MAG: S-adenosylmethionine decarboxylase [Planctomycetaceae bacterium]|nr:S-adenosylmethionine decarboxylase [Planctomycetaceae bacterium]